MHTFLLTTNFVGVNKVAVAGPLYAGAVMKCGRDAALSRHDSGPGVEHIETSASAGVP